MNRRIALKSLAATASSTLCGLTAGCLGGDSDGPLGTTTDESPAERIEWASIGLRHVAFESLSATGVRVTATVEIRNPTEYRIPVHTVSYDVRSERDGKFVTFAHGEADGCGVVGPFGENRTFLDYVREAGLPCSEEVTPTFVVEPHDTTEITAVAKPQTDAQREVANELAGASDPVYVRVDGRAVLWNTNVAVDFETETALKSP